MNQLLRSRLKVAASAFASNAAFTVALGIVPYRDGGAAAVGLVGLQTGRETKHCPHLARRVDSVFDLVSLGRLAVRKLILIRR